MYVCKMLLIYAIKLYIHIYVITYKCALSIIWLALVLMSLAIKSNVVSFIIQIMVGNYQGIDKMSMRKFQFDLSGNTIISMV